MTHARTFFAGRTIEGYAVYAHLTATPSNGTPVALTDHTMATVDRVSVSWTVANVAGTAPNYAENNGRGMSSDFFDRRMIGTGQVAPADRVIVAHAMDADTVAFIERMSAEYHLNDMAAACDHMRPGVDYVEPDAATMPEQYGRPDVTGWRIANVVCAAGTGYRYGTAWLARRVPAADWDRFAALARG